MATNDISLASLVLRPQGVPIVVPLGGEGTIATFVPDPDVVSSNGTHGPVFNIMRTPKGVITLTLYASDPANRILRGIARQQRLPEFEMGGTMKDNHDQAVNWSESFITQAAEVALEEQSATKSWTIEVGKHSIEQSS